MSRKEYEYDKYGNMIKETISEVRPGPEGFVYNVVSEEEYKYDKLGRVIWKKNSKAGAYGNSYTWYEYEYDENNVLRKSKAGGNETSEADSDTWNAVEEYDEEGNRIRGLRTVIDEQGNEWISDKYEVDAEGNVICDMRYSAKGMPYWGYEHIYDESGREIKYVQGFNTGTIQTTTYTYEETDEGYRKRAYTVQERRDDNGNLEAPEYEEGMDYEYDANGFLVQIIDYEKEESFEQRHSFYRKVYENDEDGNCIRILDCRGDYIDYEYEYTYDKHGNLTRKETAGNSAISKTREVYQYEKIKVSSGNAEQSEK